MRPPDHALQPVAVRLQHHAGTLLLFNTANELINKRRMLYSYAHKGKIHAAGRWRLAFSSHSAAYKKAHKQHNRLLEGLFITGNIQEKDCQRYFSRNHYFLTFTICF